MDAETIQQLLPEIPTYPRGSQPTDSDVWHGYDGGAEFSFSRRESRLADITLRYFQLDIKGPWMERQRLLGEFSVFFKDRGHQLSAESHDTQAATSMATWMIPAVRHHQT